MRAGSYRNKLTIQRRVESQNSASGAITNTWGNFATVYGSVRALSGREYVAAGSINSEVTHEIRFRDGNVSVTTADRVLCGGVAYDIRAVLPDERGREMLFMATVGRSDG
jgi:SPP1 family predicted phage head-tail adaptor